MDRRSNIALLSKDSLAEIAMPAIPKRTKDAYDGVLFDQTPVHTPALAGLISNVQRLKGPQHSHHMKTLRSVLGFPAAGQVKYSSHWAQYMLDRTSVERAGKTPNPPNLKAESLHSTARS